LEWLNLELQMLEAWAATGTHETELETGDPGVRACVLKTDRSRLLLVIRNFADQQFVAGMVDGRAVTLEVPGVPATDEAYRLAENGLQRLRQERNAGMRISLDQATPVSAVVLTQDSLVINFLAMELNKTRRNCGADVCGRRRDTPTPARRHTRLPADSTSLGRRIPVAGPQ
jgi:hypothetical protein